MPAIWASSERPLFVRTVWVDGMRHAVLSPDDPVVNPRLRRHPRASAEKSFPAKHRQTDVGLDRLNSCFMNLHVVVEKNFPDKKIPPRIVRRQSAPPCTRTCGEKAGGLLEIYMNDIDKLDERHENCQTLENEETTFPTSESSDYDSGVGQSLRLQRDAFSTMTECKQIDRSSDAHWNPLSERVLQWLDLSGRSQDYELEVESGENPKVQEGRRWSVARRRRRRHLSQTREDSGFMERERIVVQNYKLQKNCKLECVTKATEMKFARKRSSKMKDKMKEDDARKEERIEARAPRAEENDLRNEDESRDDRSAVWSPPGRLQLHIVMPSFNSVEKCASSLESLACD
ncbi:hypothetical protein P5V15_011978 [Pogonomyrmex californicus]